MSTCQQRLLSQEFCYSIIVTLTQGCKKNVGKSNPFKVGFLKNFRKFEDFKTEQLDIKHRKF